MIIGGSQQEVVRNIKEAVRQQQFHAKVEPSDPKLTSAESQQVIDEFWKNKQSARGRFNNHLARGFANAASYWLNLQTEFSGLNKLKQVTGAAILTTNHFNPFENTAIRVAIRRAGRKHLYIVSQETNCLATGLLGFLFNNYDILPIVSQQKNFEYMGREFPRHLQSVMAQGEIVMIYPEQEMWLNYRKPRPPQRGAYYYAARFQVPIISCFNELIDTGKKDNDEFNKTRMHLHILDPIYPDPNLSVRDCSLKMRDQDYRQKVAAYEQAFHEPLTYQWEANDIVGWRLTNDEQDR
jgi:1-acyl-sn-glycerol-3-phosphate acyltransferase